jgi:hypothetical protein
VAAGLRVGRTARTIRRCRTVGEVGFVEPKAIGFVGGEPKAVGLVGAAAEAIGFVGAGLRVVATVGRTARTIRRCRIGEVGFGEPKAVGFVGAAAEAIEGESKARRGRW